MVNFSFLFQRLHESLELKPGEARLFLNGLPIDVDLRDPFRYFKYFAAWLPSRMLSNLYLTTYYSKTNVNIFFCNE